MQRPHPGKDRFEYLGSGEFHGIFTQEVGASDKTSQTF